MAFYSNIRSKLDRAVVAYLQSVLPAETRVYPANYHGERELGSITVHSKQGRPEEMGTGNWRFTVQLTILFPVHDQTGDNPAGQRVALDELASNAIDALMQAASGESNLLETSRLITTAGRSLATTDNNADMEHFTCLWWQESGLDGGNPKDQSGSDPMQFAEIALFEAVACARQVD